MHNMVVAVVVAVWAVALNGITSHKYIGFVVFVGFFFCDCIIVNVNEG